LTACLEKTVLSEKMIKDDLSRVEVCATKSTYRLGVAFERCEDKGEKSAPNIKAHYPSNPKPSFNPKKEERKETPKPRVKAFVCMFCGRAGDLDEFCFCRKRIEKRRFDYARNSYRDEFIDFLPRSYSHVLPRTYSCALPQFTHGSNHHSYGFGS
jgi:hypothetical protein